MALTLFRRLTFCWLAASLVTAAPAYPNAEVHALGGLTPTGETYTLGGLRYFAHPASDGILNITSSLLSLKPVGAHVPLTVVLVDDPSFDESVFQGAVERYKARDDVFQEGFLNTVYVKYNGSGEPQKVRKLKQARELFNSHLLVLSEHYANSGNQIVESSSDLAPGPYFLDIATGSVHKAYRLYSDVQQAFVSGLIPQSDSRFAILPAAVPGTESATIGVPSRLYSEKSPDKPLAGYRFGAKDIFDIAGVKTGCGNRAYYSLYPERNVTASAIQILLDAGAVLVGKMKTSQFANGEIATADWVDYHEPFNPRGDGEQDTSSSSAGPAAGIASYDWLDFAIGSDTGGSIRDPAGAQGIYGSRPSHGAISLDHVMPLCSALDTAGIFAREAELWRSVARVWLHDFQDYTEYPSKIIYPLEYFSIAAPSSPAGVLVENFVSRLESFLNGKREVIGLDDLWNATKPSVDLASLDDLLFKTYSDLISIDQINLLGNPFIADYSQVHDGRTPFLDPSSEVRWTWGRAQPPGTFDEAMTNKTIFKDWFNNYVVVKNTKTCSDSLFVYPLTVGQTVYRNIYRQVLFFGLIEAACWNDRLTNSMTIASLQSHH
ncbi:amidase signature enzyme [Penicillium riverlandense]|uniref:amidase signature enzyme n=1 Tax=Penicillium riverlandense TaxID=1903569 RepID=UPI002547E91F|nr:amidase signature enzyme [Penicillium riverlandense]KAJ5815433.1 amidase signature enzyme [Penicillium riverlandense]